MGRGHAGMSMLHSQGTVDVKANGLSSMFVED